jgi:hypothetical protein
MRRREFISLIGGVAVAWPLAARAQQSDRVRVIGSLNILAEDDPEAKLRMAAFKQGLQQLGWTEGSNVRIEERWAGNDAGRVHKYAAELAALAPDVVLTSGSVTMGQSSRRSAPCQSCSCRLLIRSDPDTSIAWRDRVATPPASPNSNTV